MEKELLTPGKLYARLSEEFRARQESRCDGCRMPMVFLSERPRGGSNWSVEPAPRACQPCQQLIAEIVREHAARFDLWDPTAAYAQHPIASFVPAFPSRHH